MKKMLVMVMAVAMARALCGCGGTDSYSEVNNVSYMESTYNNSYEENNYYEENNSYVYETTENVTVNEYTTEVTESAPAEAAPLASVPRSSEDSIAVGIDMLQESLIYYESDLYNYIGTPIAVEGNVYYFHIQTLFEKAGILEVEVEDGRVVRTTWTYEYANVVDDSQIFYEDILAMVERMPYDNIHVNRSNETGAPRVSVSVYAWY